MKTNPLLEVLWRVKDDLAREADYDIDRIFAELRATEARQPGLVIRSTEELRPYSEDREHQQQTASALLFNEEPPPRGSRRVVRQLPVARPLRLNARGGVAGDSVRDGRGLNSAATSAASHATDGTPQLGQAKRKAMREMPAICAACPLVNHPTSNSYDLDV